MVKLRLSRMGRKKRPFYRIVAIDSRKRRDGRYIEKIGTYNPIASKITDQVAIDHEKALKWLLCGAQPSDTVKNLLKNQGVLLKFDMMKRIKREKVTSTRNGKEVVKYIAVKDANGNLVKQFTDEQVTKAYEEWLSKKEAKLAKLAEKKVNKLSKKAKAKLAAKNEEKAE